MGIQTHEKEIDGRRFYVNTFPARKSISILSRLMTLLGPGFAQGLKSFAGKNASAVLETDLDYNVAGSLIQELVARLDEDRVLKLIIDMLEAGAVQMIRPNDKGGSVKIELNSKTLDDFDSEFSGELFTVSKLIAFIVQVNYKDFFGKSGIGELVKSLKPTTKKSGSSPTLTPDSPTT